MNNKELIEYLALRKLHSENFLDGLSMARHNQEWGVSSEQNRIIVANEVCNLVRKETGTYGSTYDIRVALNNYVIELAKAAGV